jgi:serine phosphatase RsbU (regulator of sigma subunit)
MHWPFKRAPGRALEALAVAIAVTGSAVLAFTRDVPMPFLVFPATIWAALRFWQPGAVAGTLLVAAVAIPLTENDVGPFSGSTPDERLLLAQAFIGVVSLTSLVLAAVITERQRAEDEVEFIADTLQESLLPSHLPEIPGIETAVDFRPAGERDIVGGYFYDVYPTDDGSWMVVVGDVVGKGAAAAGTTALARYTLRAAAVHERLPSRILSELNDALLRQSPGQSCTVAYSMLELDPADGARVTMSNGGHPSPFVLRAHGEVEQIGRIAHLLGIEADPGLVDFNTDLDPGDALVLYTDGLTDAYAPGRIVAPDELAAALRSCVGRDAAGIVEGVISAVLDPGVAQPRDDILLLVLRVSERD